MMQEKLLACAPTELTRWNLSLFK